MNSYSPKYSVLNKINKFTGNKLPFNIINFISSFILYEEPKKKIKDIINEAFICWNCYNSTDNSQSFFSLYCSERCLLQSQGIYSDDDYDYDDYDSYDDYEERLQNFKDNCISDYDSD